MLWETIFNAIYFMLPAYVANMTPVFVAKLGFWQEPISQELYGSHKTFGGLTFGVIMGTIVGGIQQAIYVPEGYTFSVGVVFFLALGALLGDMLKSYFKRKVGIKPGKSWFPFDQLDFVIGALALASIFFFPDWTSVLIIVMASLVLHLITNIIGHWLKLRKHPI